MKTRSKFRLMTPGKACILLQAYISQVKRIKANEYKRDNEKTYDYNQVGYMEKYTLQLLSSIAVLNKTGSENGVLLGNKALECYKEVHDMMGDGSWWGYNSTARQLMNSEELIEQLKVAVSILDSCECLSLTYLTSTQDKFKEVIKKTTNNAKYPN